MNGFVMLWSGAIVDIPPGWHLCDGTSGTPDLRNKFVIGAGDTYDPDDTGGEANHDHAVTDPTHSHSFMSGNVLKTDPPNGSYLPAAVSGATGVTVDTKDTLPPYYALAYVMKL